MDFRQRLFQYRSYTPLPFLAAMIVLAHPTAASLIAGFVLVVAGEGLRIWGVSIAGSETRTTGPVCGSFLITTGPFAHVRNPLYLANMLIYFGAGVMANVFWLTVASVAFFFWQYSVIVGLEEEYLEQTFKDEFARYSLSVPRFAPKIRSYRKGTNPQPDLELKRGLRSERRTLQAIALLTLVLVVLWWLKR